jgi:hypothetical protein
MTDDTDRDASTGNRDRSEKLSVLSFAQELPKSVASFEKILGAPCSRNWRILR